MKKEYGPVKDETMLDKVTRFKELLDLRNQGHPLQIKTKVGTQAGSHNDEWENFDDELTLDHINKIFRVREWKLTVTDIYDGGFNWVRVYDERKNNTGRDTFGIYRIVGFDTYEVIFGDSEITERFVGVHRNPKKVKTPSSISKDEGVLRGWKGSGIAVSVNRIDWIDIDVLASRLHK